MEILGNSRHLHYLQYSLLPSFLMTGTESPQVLQSPGRIPGAGKWPVKSAQTGLSAGLPHSLGMVLWRPLLGLSPCFSHLPTTFFVQSHLIAKFLQNWWPCMRPREDGCEALRDVQKSLSSLSLGERWAQASFFGFVKSPWHCCTPGLAHCTKVRLGSY